MRVATIAGSTSAAYLDRHHVAYRSVESPIAGLKVVASGDVDALLVRYLGTS